MLKVSTSQHARQSPHSFPCVGAGQVCEPVALAPDTVSPRFRAKPSGARLSKDIALNLMLRLSGRVFSSRYSPTVRISRVGNQCLQFGVNVATFAIISRCHTPCKSPASCQRKYSILRVLIRYTIAGVHSGLRRLWNLRSNASLTCRNR